MTIPPARGRSYAALALVAVFALTACSGELADTSDNAGSTTQEEPKLPSAEPGIVFADFPESVAAAETFRPEQDEVTTPVGTLTIHNVEVVETVPAAAVEVKTREFEGEARPADGEIFRILNLSFTSDASEVAESEDQPYPVLALRSSDLNLHLSHLVTGQEHRILLSLPEDEQAHLVVSYQGDEQYVDVATGELLDEGVENTL